MDGLCLIKIYSRRIIPQISSDIVRCPRAICSPGYLVSLCLTLLYVALTFVGLYYLISPCVASSTLTLSLSHIALHFIYSPAWTNWLQKAHT